MFHTPELWGPVLLPRSALWPWVMRGQQRSALWPWVMRGQQLTLLLTRDNPLQDQSQLSKMATFYSSVIFDSEGNTTNITTTAGRRNYSGAPGAKKRQFGLQA